MEGVCGTGEGEETSREEEVMATELRGDTGLPFTIPELPDKLRELALKSSTDYKYGGKVG